MWVITITHTWYEITQGNSTVIVIIDGRDYSAFSDVALHGKHVTGDTNDGRTNTAN